MIATWPLLTEEKNCNLTLEVLAIADLLVGSFEVLTTGGGVIDES
jgi:hypothetical protein